MFASDRTADQLQMFLLLNSAAGLPGVCICPRFPDTHYCNSTLRCLPVLLTAEKLLPNSGMRNCSMPCFKEKQLFLKNKSDITWGGSVGVPKVMVWGVKQPGADQSAHLWGWSHWALPTCSSCSVLGLALPWSTNSASCTATVAVIKHYAWTTHVSVSLASMKRFSFCYCVSSLSFKWT